MCATSPQFKQNDATSAIISNGLVVGTQTTSVKFSLAATRRLPELGRKSCLESGVGASLQVHWRSMPSSSSRTTLRSLKSVRAATLRRVKRKRKIT